jgi:hypothetical protein
VLGIGPDDAINTVEVERNPEIHHYHRGSHPGSTWYIKTILPGPTILNDDTYVLFACWSRLQASHPNLVFLGKQAYDWQGKTIPGWWTIWLDEKVDVIWSWSREDGFIHEFVDFEIGLKASASLIQTMIIPDDSRLSSSRSASYSRLHEIAGFLGTYTTERQSRKKRANLRVICDGEIFPETPDRE